MINNTKQFVSKFMKIHKSAHDLKRRARLTHEIQGKNLIFHKECNYFYFDSLYIFLRA